MSHKPECLCCGTASIGRRPSDPEQDKLWSELEAKLLAIGGKRVVFHSDVVAVGMMADIPELIERGSEKILPVKFLGLAPGLCHEHAAKIWGKDTDHVTIVAGYGLYHDGLWREHSWATRNGVLLETNVQMDKYFGFELSKDEAKRFFVSNYILRHFCCLGAGIDGCKNSYPKVVKILKKDVRRAVKDLVRQENLIAAFGRSGSADVGKFLAV